MKPSSPDAFRLMMEGSAAFTDIEERGMRIDVPYLDRMIEKSASRIREMSADLRKDEVYTQWRRVYGEKSNLGSHAQLSHVIFNVMGVECTKRTKTGRPKSDEETLETVDFPFVKQWLDLAKLKKLKSTFLEGIKREVVDGFLHPFFHLHLVHTHRSSSSNPNFQNFPKHDKRQGKILRKAFIPRGDDYVLVEIDYGALEFRIAASFWKDPDMIAYASDPNLDIHRDMAAECFLLDTDQVSYEGRYFAKNQFVFPVLYGSYYISCAKNLWDMIGRAEIKTKDGVGIYDHLKSKGIKKLGLLDPKIPKPPKNTYERTIQKVERKFNERFPHWSSQKDVWWNEYLKKGYFPLSTGFVCSGVYSRNNLMNTPIQGPAFHCLLWSLIKMNAWTKKKRMKSMIVGQIHDSMYADVHRSELWDFLQKAKQIMTVDIRKHWKWILTPLEVEAEVYEKNWYEGKEIAIP